ncbi:hypothetical protein, partial [Thiolapillus sp.]
MNLLIAQMISLKRVQQSIQTLIGQILSEATILKYMMQLHHTLAACPLCQHSCPLTSVSNYYLIRGRKEIMKC